MSRIHVENETFWLVLTFQLGLLVQLGITIVSDGGRDLSEAYVPALSKLLSGSNPYLSGQAWNTSYPPLFFLLLGSIAFAGTLLESPGPSSIAWSLRTGLLIGDLLVAGLVYGALRKKGVTTIGRLAAPALILLLPSFYQMGEVWFHADIYGLAMLTGAIYLLIDERWLAGSLLLSLAAAFKIHPVLAIPLVALWLRQKGKLTLPIAGALVFPFLSFTVIPLAIVPGYYESFILQNLSSRPYWSFSPFIIPYKIFPSTLNLDLSTWTVNQTWIILTGCLSAVVFWFVRRNWQILTVADVISLGVGAWLIPLRQLFQYYAFWILIPFIMRGRLRQTLIVLLPFEIGSDIAAYAWATIPFWATSQERNMLVLSAFDMTLLVGTMTACLLMIMKTMTPPRRVVLLSSEAVEVASPVVS